jgi:hypothetical protein
MFVILDQLLIPFTIITLNQNHELEAAPQQLPHHMAQVPAMQINFPNNSATRLPYQSKASCARPDSHPTFRPVTPTLCELNLLCLAPDDLDVIKISQST